MTLPGSAADAEDDLSQVLTPFRHSVTAAESALQVQESQLAESHYRDALFEGWMLLGGLAAGDGAPSFAKDAYQRAADVAVANRRALTALARTQMALGETAEAVQLLRELLLKYPERSNIRLTLAQALANTGQLNEAIQELEEAREALPENPRVAFTLATAYLKRDEAEAAIPLFDEVLAARPIPQSYLLVGRSYRDFGQYDRARQAFAEALALDPKVRRGHFYLGTLELLTEGKLRLDEAIDHFEKELVQAPDDPMTNLYLGLAWAEKREFELALPALKIASQASPPPADAFHFLGRSQLGLGRPAEAAVSLQRALELAEGSDDPNQMSSIHYQLAQALRQLGQPEDAAIHFDKAQSFMAQLAQDSRERMRLYLADQIAQDTPTMLAPLFEDSALQTLGPADRRTVGHAVQNAMAQAYMNLGVLQTQQRRFERAGNLFAAAAELVPEFPQVQRSLGISWFNAERFDLAYQALEKALKQTPDDPAVRRMLALAALNSERYTIAAESLYKDPDRERDPALQYAYGLALVRSERGPEAERIFDQLLEKHDDWPDLHVVIGQAHAQQDNFDEAVRSFERALALSPKVAEANASLGVIYLREGKFDDAETALRAELEHYPHNDQAIFHLATVLDLNRKTQDALEFLKPLVRRRTDFADARYLFGKILLANGSPEDARPHLEAALELAPEDPNIHYQLAQAYQKLGELELAAERFEIYSEMKKRSRDAF